MASLLVGDDIIAEDNPARILVVDCAEGAKLVQDALRQYGSLFAIDACHDLQSGIDAARAGTHDVILLALELPDSWAADTYARFRQEFSGGPVLVLADSADASFATRRATPPPFCVFERLGADHTRIRRLMVSAAVFARAKSTHHASPSSAASS